MKVDNCFVVSLQGKYLPRQNTSKTMIIKLCELCLTFLFCLQVEASIVFFKNLVVTCAVFTTSSELLGQIPKYASC